MLWTIAVVLVVLWLLGFITATGGSVIHILLVIALVLIIVQLLQGKKIL
ncbi:MAG: lmo0937 family membrane protein [Clostridiaceae bacterium]